MRAKIKHYDKIRKMHKIVQSDSNSNLSHKLNLEKESFFDIGIIPKGSEFWGFIERTTPLGKTDIVA